MSEFLTLTDGDRAGPMLNAGEEYRAGVEYSAAILRASGFALVPLAEPIGTAWDLFGVSPYGLILVHVVRGGWPEMLGLQSLGVPSRWPASTGRLIHRYVDETLGRRCGCCDEPARPFPIL